ncbi:MAG: biotin--[acetyl-CoA-carboxylase] ligase [Alphaproteobacteria bacterium]
MIAADAPLQIFDDIDSTNAEARRRAERGDAGPIYLLARAQSAGRGRRGRVWQSLDGNLFLTYLGATRRPPADIALLGFAAGLALAEFCEDLLGPNIVALKWPNDLMLQGRKAAGLLLESGVLGDGRNWFAIGLGLNLATAPKTDQPTIALADFLPAAPAPEIAARDLAPRLSAWASILENEGFSSLHRAWMDRAYGLGAPAKANLGAQTLNGVMRGLSPKGELILELGNGEMRTIAAGDIHFPTPETA